MSELINWIIPQFSDDDGEEQSGYVAIDFVFAILLLLVGGIVGYLIAKA